METTVINNAVVRVDLEDITLSESNKIFRKKKDVAETSLSELAESIKQVGVIQSILLRPDPEIPGKYKLIAGERRVRASKIAGVKDIPAMIQDADESEAMTLQMIENLQRENPHFIYEAHGYKHLLEKDENLTTTMLSVQMGKSESYIIQRLKLNDLVAEVKKECLLNKMTIGHALVLSKLTAENQLLALEELSEHEGFGTVASLVDFVNRNIIKDLSAAPFNTEDPELIPKAGSCGTCPKRSGAAPLLFSDVKEKNCCFDNDCFIKKCNTYLIKKVTEIIETQPEIVFLCSHYEAIPEVLELIQNNKLKVYQEYNDFNDYEKKGTKVQGFWISGKKAGQLATIHLKKSVSIEIPDEKLLITKIQDRIKRGRELDQEKVYSRIVEEFKKHPASKKGSSMLLNSDEEVFALYIIYDKAGYQVKNDIKKLIGLTKENPEKLYSLLKTLTPEQKAIMLRKVIIDQYCGVYPNSDHAFIVRKIAESYGDIPIKTFEDEQVVIRNKRETRANEKIAGIKKDFPNKKSKK